MDRSQGAEAEEQRELRQPQEGRVGTQTVLSDFTAPTEAQETPAEQGSRKISWKCSSGRCPALLRAKVSRGTAKQTQPVPECCSPHPVQENSLHPSPQFITSSPFKWCLKTEQKSSHLIKELTSSSKTQLFPQAFPSAAPAGLRRMWGLRDQLQRNPRQVFTIPASSHTDQGLCRGLGVFSHLYLLLHNLQAQVGAAKRHVGSFSTAGRVPKVAINEENHFAFCFVTCFADSK